MDFYFFLFFVFFCFFLFFSLSHPILFSLFIPPIFLFFPSLFPFPFLFFPFWCTCRFVIVADFRRNNHSWFITSRASVDVDSSNSRNNRLVVFTANNYDIVWIRNAIKFCLASTPIIGCVGSLSVLHFFFSK